MCSAANLCLTLALAPLPQPSVLIVEPQPAVLAAQPESEGYSGQLLAVDGAVLAVSTLLAAAQKPVPAGALGAGGYLLDGVVVHALHRNGERALGSFALRVGLPFLAGALGVAVAPCGPPSPELGSCPGALPGALIGSMVGALAAILIDDLALAGH